MGIVRIRFICVRRDISAADIQRAGVRSSNQRCWSKISNGASTARWHLCSQGLFGFHVSLLFLMLWDSYKKRTQLNKHNLKVKPMFVSRCLSVIHSNGEKALGAPVLNIAIRLRWTECFVKTCLEHVGNHLQCSPLRWD